MGLAGRPFFASLSGGRLRDWWWSLALGYEQGEVHRLAVRRSEGGGKVGDTACTAIRVGKHGPDWDIRLPRVLV
jgi:hypothetical protein